LVFHLCCLAISMVLRTFVPSCDLHSRCGVTCLCTSVQSTQVPRTPAGLAFQCATGDRPWRCGSGVSLRCPGIGGQHGHGPCGAGVSRCCRAVGTGAVGLASVLLCHWLWRHGSELILRCRVHCERSREDSATSHNHGGYQRGRGGSGLSLRCRAVSASAAEAACLCVAVQSVWVLRILSLGVTTLPRYLHRSCGSIVSMRYRVISTGAVCGYTTIYYYILLYTM
jgi:hypothetical protein